MNFGEKLHTELKNIKTKCISVNKYNKKEKEIIYSILELQKNTGLNIDKLKDLIIKYSKGIDNDKSKTILEGFENPKNFTIPKEVYINSNNRGFNNDYDIFDQALYEINN